MKHLREILAEAAKQDQMKNLWVVFYQIIGRRENGSYLVNAKTKAEAKKIVQAIDEDYARIEPEKFAPHLKDMEMTLDEYLGDGIKIPKPGKYAHVEEGT